MKRTFWITWLLVGLMLVIVPMAWASPIDPTWIKGMYDDADFDDVVLYLTGGTFGIPALPLDGLLPPLECVLFDPVAEEIAAPAPALPAFSPRAPPLV
jgi:hypothetical protein